MTRTGLIIGASHAAALRLAYGKWRGDWLGMTLEFAALQGSVDDLMVQDGTLVARDDAARAKLQVSSGKTSFALADYGFVAVCGGVSGSFSGIRLYNQARCHALPSVAAGQMPTGEVSLLSNACFAAALRGIIRSRAAFDLLTCIGQTVDQPLYAISEPMLSYAGLADKTRFHGFRTLRRNGDAQAMAILLEAASSSAYAGLAHYIPPPDAVRKDGYFTDPALRRGATRLGAADQVPQPADDYLHGNADYGRHILTALHDALPDLS